LNLVIEELVKDYFAAGIFCGNCFVISF